MSFVFTSFLEQALSGKTFSIEETTEIFEAILAGEVSAIQLASFLTVLRMRTETVEELEGAVRAMRHYMIPVNKFDPTTIDVCGTGGDGKSTLNISTAVSFVLAALGVSVAKHGNRAQSSQSGGTDVLAALGIDPQSDLKILQSNLNQFKITFLSAFVHHPSLNHINKIRKDLAIRTIFNLLGPLCNPANVAYHLIGVYDPFWLTPFVRVLKELGSKRAWVVHGFVDELCSSSGVDEITLSGPSKIMVLEKNKIFPIRLTSKTIEKVGLNLSPLSAIRGGSPKENAEAILALLRGKKNVYRDTVLINAAIALHIVKDYSLVNLQGEIDSHILKKLISQAAYAIDSGAALSVLNNVKNSIVN
ncbi:Anthranilate phosphoribosyltransferase 2 [Commensalibacter sp. Nvir]|uniref:anthranilate phosphoribosyltransferase n=1 Tax=Commensalibacter sp. Nvir TaxID=3069817 RepID=UPI002D3D4AF8|nr:Anthranilate phosphoribosyltransferase 2 [Commensalibacter sp. Nvir]